MADDLNDEQARLRAAFDLERATEFLKILDQVHALAKPALTEDVDQAMQKRAARIEASGNPALAHRFLSSWTGLSEAGRARARRVDQATADALDDATDEFERAWADTQTWLEEHT